MARTKSGTFARKSPLSYPRETYRFADTARTIPDARAEYRKLRNVAMNRIRKLERAGYGDTETVRNARKAFAALPKNLTQDQAAQRLPEAARFLESARGTVGGMRQIEKKTAQTFQDRGLSFVNQKNVKQFTEFLDWLGADKLSKKYYEAVSGAPREGLTPRTKVLRKQDLQEAFNTWRQNQ